MEQVPESSKAQERITSNYTYPCNNTHQNSSNNQSLDSNCTT